MRSVGQAYVDGRFKRAEDIDDTYNSFTHRFGESKKLPLIIVNCGVCAQLEQFVVELLGDWATNQCWEEIRANCSDTYGHKISQYRPGYLYYNFCQAHISDQEQAVSLGKEGHSDEAESCSCLEEVQKYGQMFMHHYMKQAEEDTDIDVNESQYCLKEWWLI